MNQCGIYKITCLENNKIYIGQTKNYEARILSHLRDLKSNRHTNRHLQFLYNKYGETSLIFEFILECSLDQLNAEEQNILNEYIEIDKSKIINIVFNIVNPMRGRRHSDQTKQKMSEERVGNKNAFFGKKHTQESLEKMRNVKLGKKASEDTKKKMSEKRKGSNNSFYGKFHSDETKTLLSEKQKDRFSREKNPFFGRHHSKETIDKFKTQSSCRSCELLSPTGELFKFFSLSEAARHIGIDKGNLHKLIIGKAKTCKGWKLCSP